MLNPNTWLAYLPFAVGLTVGAAMAWARPGSTAFVWFLIIAAIALFPYEKLKR